MGGIGQYSVELRGLLAQTLQVALSRLFLFFFLKPMSSHGLQKPIKLPPENVRLEEHYNQGLSLTVKTSEWRQILNKYEHASLAHIPMDTEWGVKTEADGIQSISHVHVIIWNCDYKNTAVQLNMASIPKCVTPWSRKTPLNKLQQLWTGSTHMHTKCLQSEH